MKHSIKTYNTSIDNWSRECSYDELEREIFFLSLETKLININVSENWKWRKWKKYKSLKWILINLNTIDVFRLLQTINRCSCVQMILGFRKKKKKVQESLWWMPRGMLRMEEWFSLNCHVRSSYEPGESVFVCLSLSKTIHFSLSLSL